MVGIFILVVNTNRKHSLHLRDWQYLWKCLIGMCLFLLLKFIICRYNFCKELSTSAYNGIYTFENIDKNTKPYLVYCQLASRVKTTRKFIKVAYPDMISAESVQEPHYLINNYYNCSRYPLRIRWSLHFALWPFIK